MPEETAQVVPRVVVQHLPFRSTVQVVQAAVAAVAALLQPVLSEQHLREVMVAQV